MGSNVLGYVLPALTCFVAAHAALFEQKQHVGNPRAGQRRSCIVASCKMQELNTRQSTLDAQ